MTDVWEIAERIHRVVSEELRAENGEPPCDGLSSQQIQGRVQLMRNCDIDEAPSVRHNRYVMSRINDGWKYGCVYSKANKTSPMLALWGSLTPAERLKSKIFAAVCRSVRDILKESENVAVADAKPQ